MTEEITITILDYLMIFLIVMVYVVRNFFRHRAMSERMDAGEEGILLREYNDTLIILWGGTVLIMAVWFWSGRTLQELGIYFDVSTANLIGWAFVAVISLLLVAQVAQITRNPDAAETIRNHLKGEPGMLRIMPKTPREYSRFRLLSITAGITEEIIFRGYLIWVFSIWLPVWWAALCALAIFVGAHLYQESVRSLVKVAAVGAALTVLYVLSGSLLTTIVLHAVIDLTSGASVWRAMRQINA